MMSQHHRIDDVHVWEREIDRGSAVELFNWDLSDRTGHFIDVDFRLIEHIDLDADIDDGYNSQCKCKIPYK